MRTFYRAPQRALFAARALYENSGSACFFLHRSTVKLKNYRIRTIIRGFHCHTFLIGQRAWGWTFWGWREHSQNLTIGFLFSSGYREVLASTLDLSKNIMGPPASLQSNSRADNRENVPKYIGSTRSALQVQNCAAERLFLQGSAAVGFWQQPRTKNLASLPSWQM